MELAGRPCGRRKTHQAHLQHIHPALCLSLKHYHHRTTVVLFVPIIATAPSISGAIYSSSYPYDSAHLYLEEHQSAQHGLPGRRRLRRPWPASTQCAWRKRESPINMKRLLVCLTDTPSSNHITHHHRTTAMKKKPDTPYFTPTLPVLSAGPSTTLTATAALPAVKTCTATASRSRI